MKTCIYTALAVVLTASLAACETDPAECEPETDLAFCARQGFDCGSATGFDNCETSRTVTCGMCTPPNVCGAQAPSVCGVNAPMDGGADVATDVPADIATDTPPLDTGVPDVEMDAGSCLAENGWPALTLPPEYAADGFEVGDRIGLFERAIDQNGATDVSLGQFYGAMVLVTVQATWNPVDQQSAENSEVRSRTLNADSTDYSFVEVAILVDDDDPDEGSGFALGSDALAWARAYGITSPVVAGEAAFQFGADSGNEFLPTYFVLDPTFEIRRVIAGYPGEDPLLSSVRDSWAEFRAENPGFTSSYCSP